MAFITHTTDSFLGSLHLSVFVRLVLKPSYLMIRLIFLLLLVLPFGSSASYQIKERIPELIKKLCPKSNICRSNYSVENNEFDQDTDSCCTDCSCEPNCKTTGDCCFVSDTRSADLQIDTGGLEGADDNHECLFTVTGKPDQSDFHFFRSYQMYYSHQEGKTFDKAELCENKKVAPWGSLLPVFSKQTKLIYKNEVCAKASNITDLIIWDAILTCSSINVEIVTDLERDEIRKECRVFFEYLGNLEDIKSQICFKDMIGSCRTSEFEVPGSVISTKEEIKEACESGFVSPYFGHPYYLYANVFCFICSDIYVYFGADEICPKYDRRGQGTLGSVFIALINLDPLTRSTENIEQNPTACPVNSIQNTSLCRPVLCPAGQIRHHNGNCFFSTKVWYNNDYSVGIELKSGQNINIKELFQWKDEHTMIDIKPLSLPSLPKLKSWYINQMFYEKEDYSNDDKMKSLLVYMKRSFGTIEPGMIIQNIRLLLSSTWSIQYKNETVTLEPSLTKMKYPYSFDEVTFSDQLINNTFGVKLPLYKHIYDSGQTGDGLLVTKIFFCERLELAYGEFFVSKDQLALFNIIGRNYIFEAEFVFMSEDVVSVCLENSGFAKNNHKEMPKNGAKKIIQLLTAVLLLVLLAIVRFDENWLLF